VTKSAYSLGNLRKGEKKERPFLRRVIKIRRATKDEEKDE